MRILLSLSFLLCAVSVKAQQCVNIYEHVTDSIAVTGLPVKSGFIYKYDDVVSSRNINASPIVSVYTSEDSAFYFEDAEVIAVYKIDSSYSITLRNNKEEFITYSNLRSASVKKRDQLHRSSFIGLIDKADSERGNQLDIIVTKTRTGEELPEIEKERRRRKGDAIKTLSYVKCTEYILRMMSNNCGSSSATIL
jgi:hypothetical protein